jgi:hypothetical protein
MPAVSLNPLDRGNVVLRYRDTTVGGGFYYRYWHTELKATTGTLPVRTPPAAPPLDYGFPFVIGGREHLALAAGLTTYPLNDQNFVAGPPGYQLGPYAMPDVDVSSAAAGGELTRPDSDPLKYHPKPGHQWRPAKGGWGEVGHPVRVPRAVILNVPDTGTGEWAAFAAAVGGDVHEALRLLADRLAVAARRHGADLLITETAYVGFPINALMPTATYLGGGLVELTGGQDPNIISVLQPYAPVVPATFDFSRGAVGEVLVLAHVATSGVHVFATDRLTGTPTPPAFPAYYEQRGPVLQPLPLGRVLLARYRQLAGRGRLKTVVYGPLRPETPVFSQAEIADALWGDAVTRVAQPFSVGLLETQIDDFFA